MQAGAHISREVPFLKESSRGGPLPADRPVPGLSRSQGDQEGPRAGGSRSPRCPRPCSLAAFSRAGTERGGGRKQNSQALSLSKGVRCSFPAVGGSVLALCKNKIRLSNPGDALLRAAVFSRISLQSSCPARGNLGKRLSPSRPVTSASTSGGLTVLTKA